MTLSERLKLKQCKNESVTVDGDVYVVRGMSKRERGKLFAQARKKDGTINTDLLEAILLEYCVSDDTGSKATRMEWDVVPSHITGPLVAKIMEVCGLDKDDLEKDEDDADPKD